MLDPILLDVPELLETERLLLRPPRAGDGPQLHEAIVESLPELRRFLSSVPWVAQEQTVASAELYCRTAASNVLARKDLPFLIFERESWRLIGSAGLHRTHWATPKTEVGYWSRASCARRGFIVEAVTGLVDFAFETLRMARVELVTDEENAASRRVAERCGFELEGVLRHESRTADGSLRNVCMYARVPGAI